jgi:RNA polymerase sigma-70 factor (ECF subfamily)
MDSKDYVFPIPIEEWVSKDSILIERALIGDLDAYNQIVLLYQNMAYNVAFQVLGDRPTSEDVVQEAFLSAYVNLKKFHGRSFKAWLLRIVINACYDEIRHQKSRPTTSLFPEDSNEDEIESPYWINDPKDTPEEALIYKELRTMLQNSFDQLDVESKVTEILVDVMEMSYSEAAKVLNVPVGTIKSRLSRARGKLRFFLVKSGAFPYKNEPTLSETDLNKFHPASFISQR